MLPRKKKCNCQKPYKYCTEHREELDNITKQYKEYQAQLIELSKERQRIKQEIQKVMDSK